MPRARPFTRMTYLNNYWTETCVLLLVGVAHAFGLVVHVQQKCEPRNWRIEKDGKTFVERVREFTGNVVLKMAVRFLCFASRYSSLTYLSTSPRTSRGGSCVFNASLSSFPFSCQSPGSSHFRHNFLTMTPLASAVYTNQCQHVTNCILKRDQFYF